MKHNQIEAGKSTALPIKLSMRPSRKRNDMNNRVEETDKRREFQIIGWFTIETVCEDVFWEYFYKFINEIVAQKPGLLIWKYQADQYVLCRRVIGGPDTVDLRKSCVVHIICCITVSVHYMEAI